MKSRPRLLGDVRTHRRALLALSALAALARARSVYVEREPQPPLAAHANEGDARE
jgi:hypothetical protein